MNITVFRMVLKKEKIHQRLVKMKAKTESIRERNTLRIWRN